MLTNKSWFIQIIIFFIRYMTLCHICNVTKYMYVIFKLLSRESKWRSCSLLQFFNFEKFALWNEKTQKNFNNPTWTVTVVTTRSRPVPHSQELMQRAELPVFGSCFPNAWQAGYWSETRVWSAMPIGQPAGNNKCRVFPGRRYNYRASSGGPNFENDPHRCIEKGVNTIGQVGPLQVLMCSALQDHYFDRPVVAYWVAKIPGTTDWQSKFE